MDEFKR